MRSNVVSEAGLPTRLHQWWEGIPFLTSAVVIVCSVIYLVCLLIGYDSFSDICFLPSAILSRFQVYRVYTSIFFHASLLHVLFNMLALVPLGSDLERIMGSVRLTYMIILLAAASAVFNIIIVLLIAHNPFHPFPDLMNECSIGFSGVLFSMIVIETSLSGLQSISVFGLFNVPSKWYPWILLIIFQLLMEHVSFLGHLCGILSGFAYTYGVLNFMIPGTNFFSNIESSSWLATLVRRPKFIISSGGNSTGYIPTYTGQTTTSSGVTAGNLWSHLSSWMPLRNTSPESTEAERFPGHGRTLSSGGIGPHTTSRSNNTANLQARLLDDDGSDPLFDPVAVHAEDGRVSSGNIGVEHIRVPSTNQGVVASDEEVEKLVAMGFDKTQVEVALAAADGDLNIAVEILMTQQQG